MKRPVDVTIAEYSEWFLALSQSDQKNFLAFFVFDTTKTTELILNLPEGEYRTMAMFIIRVKILAGSI